MKTTLIALTLLCFTNLLSANQEVEFYLRSPQAPAWLFHAWLSMHPNSKSYAETLTHQPIDEELEKKLYTAIRQMKWAEFENSPLLLQKTNDLTHLATKYRWQPQHQIVFQYAFLKLAEKQPETKTQYLHNALSFGSLSESQQKLWETELQHLETEKILWRPYENLSDFDWLTLNGQNYRIEETLLIPLHKTNYRLDLFSNAYKQQTVTLNAIKIPSYQPLRKPLVSGTCEQPKTALKTVKIFTIFYSSECQKVFNKTPAERNENPSSDKLPTASKKRRWLWFGLGALLGGAGASFL